VQNRLKPFISFISSLNYNTIIIFSHKNAIIALLALLTDRTLRDLIDINVMHCDVVELEKTLSNCKIVSLHKSSM